MSAQRRSEGNELTLPTGEAISIRRGGPGEVFEFEAVIPPGLSGPPAHWHRTEAESFEVLDGVLRVRVGRERRDLYAGDSVTVEPGIVHSFENPSVRSALVVVRETPAGQLEEQFRAMAEEPPMRALLRIAEINEAHGLTFGLHWIPAVPQRVMWRALAGLSRRTRGRPRG